jgi:Transmembrane secretion effector
MASAVSAFGDGLLVTGLPLLARAATESPLLVSGVLVGSRVPWIFGLLLGAAADRRDAKWVMIASDIARGALLAALGISLLLTDGPLPIWVIIGAAALLGAGQITFFAASQRAVPHLVGSQDLEQANSTFAVVTNAGEQFVGPQMGALFLRGGTVPIIGDAISFAGSAALLASLPAIPPEADERSFRDSVSIGWRSFTQNRLVKLVTLFMTLSAMISAAAIGTEVILVRDTLNKSDAWFGAFTLVLAAGALVGSALAPRLIKIFGYATSPLALIGCGLSYLAIVGQSWPVVFVAMFVQQAWTMVAAVDTITIRQRAIPSEVRGRVTALSRSFAFGSQAFGALGGGLIAEHYGTDPLFVVAGISTCVVALALARPLRRELRRTAQRNQSRNQSR